MTCQFRRVRRKKSDIRVAIYYFDFMCRDGAEIDRVSALLITLLSMALLYSVLLFGGCYVGKYSMLLRVSIIHLIIILFFSLH